MIKIKTGVKPRNLIIAAAIANVAQELNITLTVTSGIDGKHMVDSKHYIGEALDIRTRGVESYRKDVIKNLKIRLGMDYDVIDESDHIHVEYDPKITKTGRKHASKRSNESKRRIAKR
jgi:hypothetical protein